MTASALRLMDYHAAREAEELLLEAAAGTRLPGGDRDATHFYRQTGAADLGGREPTTWKRWLQQTRNQDPSPDDWAALDAADDVTLREMHAAAEELRGMYERACAARSAHMAMMHNQGKSYAVVGAVLGISRAAAHKACAAHDQRETSGWTEGDW